CEWQWRCIVGEACMYPWDMVLKPGHGERVHVTSPDTGQRYARQEVPQEPAAPRAEIQDSTKVRPLHAQRCDCRFQRSQAQTAGFVKTLRITGPRGPSA